MRIKNRRAGLAGLIVLGIFTACTTKPTGVNPQYGDPTAVPTEPPAEVVSESGPRVVSYTLQTLTGGEVAMAFVGVGGDIDGVSNPTLTAEVGDVVEIKVVSGEPILHNFAIEGYGVQTEDLIEEGQVAIVRFAVTAPGEFTYFCNVPGHKEAGMGGSLFVTGEAIAGASTSTVVAAPAAEPEVAPADENAVSIVRHPTDIPEPVGDREPETIRVDLETIEVVGQLADGTTYSYFTFGGQIPGPMIRGRVGDTFELHLHNNADNLYAHNIDLHAVTGPGGGAVYTATQPGEESVFTFQALQPGLYVYHCATPSIPHHISSGMYGLILIEPEGGLEPVDREFYMMQGEIYTVQPFGTEGHLEFDHDKMLDEHAEYVVFNGAAGALAMDENALNAEVGDTIRIFFGVGGPNYTSSFHVIGEIFDRVYNQASITAPPMTDVQTTVVPPGGATMVELSLQVPGTYILVDHALSRLERGLVGLMHVAGEDNPDIFTEGILGN